MSTVQLILKDVVKTWALPSIESEATAFAAMKKMLEEDSYSLLVPRKGKTDAYGIVTKKDLISKVVAEGKDPKKVKVKDVMSKPLVVLTNPLLGLRWVAKAMANSGISTLVVFDKGDFYGFVTESCIIVGIYNQIRRAKLDQGADFVSC